jgi:nucleoside-diphosphate-sugar epimerase
MTKVGLFGAKGFVGSAILTALNKHKYEVDEITRDNYEDALKNEYDYVINAACTSKRFRANSEPLLDFDESVKKTADIFYRAKYKKFIQISSLSAKYQTETVYGRNRLAAEDIVNDGKSLIVRLGAMYGPTLKKGVLIDMIDNSIVYASSESRYSFSPLSFNANWIANNLDKTGIIEVGAKNSMKIKDLADKLNLDVKFVGSVDNQIVVTVLPEYPDVNLVMNFMKQKIKEKERIENDK